MSDDDSVLSHTPPKKAKKAPASKKSGPKPLADLENEADGAGDQKESNTTEKYQKASIPRFSFAIPYRLTNFQSLLH